MRHARAGIGVVLLILQFGTVAKHERRHQIRRAGKQRLDSHGDGIAHGIPHTRKGNTARLKCCFIGKRACRNPIPP